MGDENREKKKSLLKSYYNDNANEDTNKKLIANSQIRNPMDINNVGFDPDTYLTKQIKVKIYLKCANLFKKNYPLFTNKFKRKKL